MKKKTCGALVVGLLTMTIAANGYTADNVDNKKVSSEDSKVSKEISPCYSLEVLTKDTLDLTFDNPLTERDCSLVLALYRHGAEFSFISGYREGYKKGFEDRSSGKPNKLNNKTKI